jgi:hypothetical protein
MENWSDQPIEPFRVKFFLDTNILCDLVSNSFRGVNYAISWLSSCDFADLNTSKYVMFEFLDVRKKLLYLEEVERLKMLELNSKKKWWHFRHSIFKHKKTYDPNKLVRYKENYGYRQLEFHAYKSTISERIKNDIIELENLNIQYLDNLLHDKLLAPTKELNLYSKLSREDSIVTISSIWPDESSKEAFLVLLTRDKPYVESYNEINLGVIFESHALNPPILNHIGDIKLLNGSKVNLTDTNDDNKLEAFLPNKLKELIIQKNDSLFLGKTFTPTGDRFPSDAMSFKLKSNAQLRNNIYLIIIGKDLDFMYSIRKPVSDFYHNSASPIADYPFSNFEESNVAFTPKDDTTGISLSLETHIINRLREDGNLVFINPDGLE